MRVGKRKKCDASRNDAAKTIIKKKGEAHGLFRPTQRKKAYAQAPREEKNKKKTETNTSKEIRREKKKKKKREIRTNFRNIKRKWVKGRAPSGEEGGGRRPCKGGAQ